MRVELLVLTLVACGLLNDLGLAERFERRRRIQLLLISAFDLLVLERSQAACLKVLLNLMLTALRN